MGRLQVMCCSWLLLSMPSPKLALGCIVLGAGEISNKARLQDTDLDWQAATSVTCCLAAAISRPAMHQPGHNRFYQMFCHSGVMRRYGMEWVGCKQCMLLPGCCNCYLLLGSCVAYHSAKMAAMPCQQEQVSPTGFAAS